MLLFSLATLCACGGKPPAGGETPAIATSEPQNPGEPDPADTVQAPFLWEITGGGAPSYLLGTVHVGISAVELPEIVWTEFLAAETVIMETDIEAALTMGQGFVGGTAEDGAEGATSLPLDAQIGDEAWGRLVEEIGDRVPAATLKTWPPWLAFTVLVMAEYSAAMDVELYGWAKARKQTLVFLESGTLQNEVLSEAITAEVLETSLDDVDAARAGLRAFIDAYHTGSGTALGAAVADENVRALLQVGSRNNAWLDTLRPHLDSGGAFIIVGVAHNFGTSSLPALLRADGYTVERLGVGTPATIPLPTPEQCDHLARHKTGLQLADPAYVDELLAQLHEIDPDFPTDEDTLSEVVYAANTQDGFYQSCAKMPAPMFSCALAAADFASLRACSLAR